MSDPARALEALDRAIADAEPEDLPALALAVSARLGTLAARMSGAPVRRWAMAERAAEDAGVTVKQLRRWARRPGVTWATWPTRRTMRVDVEAFDRWLTAGRFRRIRPATDRARSRPKAAGTIATVDARTAASDNPAGTIATVDARTASRKG